jgi:hypothetical protein
VRFAPAIVTARAVKAALAQQRGDLAEAERVLGEALALCEQTGARYAEGRVHFALAELVQARGDREPLTRHLETARARFLEVGAPAWTACAEALAREAGVALAASS